MFSRRRHRDAGVDALLDRLLLQVLGRSLRRRECPSCQGFWTTRPWISPFAQRRHELLAAVEADELDLAREPGALQREQHPERRGLVRAEDAVDARPWRIASAGSRRRSATSPTSARRTDCSRSISIPGNFAFIVVEEARLAVRRARVALLVAQHDDAALAAEQRPEPLGAERRRPSRCRSRRSSRSRRP